jgi:VPDSG-CTERM motif
MLTRRILPLLRCGVLATALSAAFASPALADKITVTGHSDYRTGPGGEFNIRAADAAGTAFLSSILPNYFFAGANNIVGTADGSKMDADGDANTAIIGFQTFCLEYGESISLNTTYNYTVSTAAYAGGGGASGSPLHDPISIGTAYLYSLFATGGLGSFGYDYSNGAGRAASATQLQNAFWYLENERTLAEIGGSNAFVTLAINQFGGTLAGAQANNDTSLYGVRVLNLTSDSGALKQSQLIHVPDGGATLMLLGLGMSGLALLRRKSN